MPGARNWDADAFDTTVADITCGAHRPVRTRVTVELPTRTNSDGIALRCTHCAFVATSAEASAILTDVVTFAWHGDGPIEARVAIILSAGQHALCAFARRLIGSTFCDARIGTNAARAKRLIGRARARRTPIGAGSSRYTRCYGVSDATRHPNLAIYRNKRRLIPAGQEPK